MTCRNSLRCKKKHVFCGDVLPHSVTLYQRLNLLPNFILYEFFTKRWIESATFVKKDEVKVSFTLFKDVNEAQAELPVFILVDFCGILNGRYPHYESE